MSRLLFTLAAACALASGSAVLAEGNEGGEGGGFGAVQDQATQTECSACHMAYPAELLPPESWHALMGNLANHFGEDASMDPKTATAIESYLVANATQMRGVDPANPPLRITEFRWFRNTHGQRLADRAATDSRIGSMSNCVACHGGAASGSFGE